MTKKTKGHQKFWEIDDNFAILGEMSKFSRETPKKTSFKNFGTNLAHPFLKFWFR